MSNEQTFTFQAEVNQLLKLVVHSLYSNKEIFLRELISNGSDALDKARFRAVSDANLLGDDNKLELRIRADESTKTISIEDNGIGMTREELQKNLGTIAHSGTRAFLEEMTKEGAKPDLQLIGQFGVGFYSSFLVADRVEVVSRALGSNESWRWSSAAHDTFTIEPANRERRGTEVILHLRDDQREYLSQYKLKDLITRYSDFVGYPILLAQEKENDESEVKYEVANQASALWQRPKNEITEEQYQQFYEHLTDDNEKPLARAHFTVEGTQLFVGLLYIPRKAPFELFRDLRKGGVRLFVRRVYIMDDAEALLPQWLRFVRGVVDSDDLPLNVSRELLQDSSVARGIKRGLTRKVLDVLDDMAKNRKEDYEIFWKAFGPVLKEGVHVDFENKNRIAELLRYEDTRGEGLTSLADYVEKMPLRQKEIYFVLGESVKALEGSPHLEALRKQGYAVLLMTDPIDEFVVEALREYKGKKLISAMRADLKVEDESADKGEQAKHEAAVKPLLDRAKEVLGVRVRDVRVSHRLTDSPCCLVVAHGAPHAYLERLMKEAGRDAGGDTRRILEVNPNHPLVQNLTKLVQSDDRNAGDWIELLYDQALLTEGSKIEDPNRFARKMTELLTKATSA